MSNSKATEKTNKAHFDLNVVIKQFVYLESNVDM